MGVWAIVLIIVLAVFTLLAASVLLPVRFRLRAAFRDGRFTYSAAVRHPLIPWYVMLPGLGRRRGRAVAGGHEGVSATAPASSPESTPGSIRSRLASLRGLVEAARSHYPEIADLVSYAARSVTVVEFIFRSSIGTGDAAGTAVLVGGLRAVAGMAMATARRKGIRFRVRPEVRISPMFDRGAILGEVHLVASVVPLRGIIAGVRLLRHVRKSKRPARGVVSKPARWNTRA